MNSHKKTLGLAFLAIPFLAMMLMIGINFYNVTAHKEYRIEIEGYDPRDLLKGHYLQFRYVWPVKEVNIKSHYACACLSGATESPAVVFSKCPDKRYAVPDNCQGHMKVQRDGGSYQPVQDLRQYYIPEEHASRLEDMLRAGKHKFSVGIVLRENGEAQVKMMYVDGETLDHFLKGPFRNVPTTSWGL